MIHGHIVVWGVVVVVVLQTNCHRQLRFNQCLHFIFINQLHVKTAHNSFWSRQIVPHAVCSHWRQELWAPSWNQWSLALHPFCCRWGSTVSVSGALTALRIQTQCHCWTNPKPSVLEVERLNGSLCVICCLRGSVLPNYPDEKWSLGSAKEIKQGYTRNRNWNRYELMNKSLYE